MTQLEQEIETKADRLISLVSIAKIRSTQRLQAEIGEAVCELKWLLSLDAGEPIPVWTITA